MDDNDALTPETKPSDPASSRKRQRPGESYASTSPSSADTVAEAFGKPHVARRHELGYGTPALDPYTSIPEDEDDETDATNASSHLPGDSNRGQPQSLAEAEPVEHARRLYESVQGEDILVLEEVLSTLDSCKQVYDLEHVEWLITLCRRGEDQRLERIQEEAMRLVDGWARNLQTYIPADGVPVPDPLRDELIDSAVTFLEDEQVKDRSVDEKVQFLLDKGLNRTEIRIACAQVGVEPPSSLLYSEPLRHEMVKNGASFLTIDDVKDKPLAEKLSFLKSKGLADGEIMRACELARLDPLPTPEDLKGLHEYQERAPREDMVKNGAIFLNHKSMASKTLREKLEFLKTKGMTATEVAKACERAKVDLPSDLRKEFAASTTTTTEGGRGTGGGSDGSKVNEASSGNAKSGRSSAEDGTPESVRSEMVQKGVTFLSHPSVVSKPVVEKLAFLREKSLTEAEIKQACKETNVAYIAGTVGLSQENVRKAVAFLRHPSAQGRPLQEKISYLRSKGLSTEEIEAACRQVGVRSAGIGMSYTNAELNEPFEDVSEEDDRDSSSKTPKTLTNEEVESMRRVRQGQRFLLHEKTQKLENRDKVSFLLGKGLSLDEIESCFAVVGLPWDEEEMKSVKPEDQSKARMERAERFLEDQREKVPEDETFDAQKQALFLCQQGIPEKELSRVFEKLGLELDTSKLDEDMVNIGRTFAQKAGTGAKARNFLQKEKNLSEDQINRAFQGLENNPVELARRFLTSSQAAREPLAERINYLRQHQNLSDEHIREALQLAGLEATEQDFQDPATVDPLVAQGATFLSSAAAAAASLSQKKEFLSSKGLSKSQIMAAFQRAGLDPEKETVPRPEADPLVIQGRAFLTSPKTASVSLAERAAFLRSKGLSEEQIKSAFELSNQVLPSQAEVESASIKSARSPTSSSEPSSSKTSELASSGDALVDQGARFLLNEQAAAASVAERKSFLRSKGLSEDQIHQAFKHAGVSESSIRKEMVDRGTRFLKDPNTADTPIEDRIEFLKQQGLTEDEVLQAAVQAKVSLVPSHLCTIPSKQLREDSNKESLDTEPSGRALQHAMNAMVSLLPTVKIRATPSGRFGSRVLMLLATCLCRSRPARVPAACIAFSSLSMSKGLRNHEAADIDLAVESDVQAFLEACVELAARAAQINTYAKEGLDQMQQVNLHFISCGDVVGSVLRFWRSNSAADVNVDTGMILARAVHGHFSPAAAYQPMKSATEPAIEKVLEHMSTERRGLAPVAAAFFAAGLLRGAPDYAWANDVERSPQPRVEAGFRQLARKSAKLEDKVVSSGLGCAIVYADTQVSWSNAMTWAVAECLFNEALGGFFLASGCASLEARSNASRRFNEREIFKLAPQLVSLIVSKLSSSQATWATRRLHKFAVHVHRICRDDAELTGVLARRTTLALYGTGEVSTSEENNVEQATPVDLGIHAELARLLQMGYLTTIVIGAKTVPLTSDWVLVWDAMANLNAFQVRVQDTVDLEDLLKRMLHMEEERGVGVLLGLLGIGEDDDGTDMNDFGVADPRAKGMRHDDPRKQLYDWVLAGRLEFLLDTGEEWLHDKLPESAALATLLLDVAVAHPFVHLNMRAHRWITDMLRNYASGQSEVKADPLGPPPLPLAIIPSYVDASIEAHPHATATRTLSFAIGSTLTALSNQHEERAQPLALMTLERLMLALDDRIAGRPEFKQDGAILAKILFSSLKATAWPIFPMAVDEVVDVIERAPLTLSQDHSEEVSLSDEKDSETPPDGSSRISRKELVELMFNAIQTTDDQPRRMYLAKAYLKLVQSSTCRL